MTTINPYTLRIGAFDAGYVDLDEHDCCIEFGQEFEKEANLHSRLDSITLDLRKCFIEYLHVSFFLNAALNKLRKGEEKSRILTIQTTVDLFSSANSCASLFFQISDFFSCGNSDGPDEVARKVSSVCSELNLQVVIEVYAFNQTSDSDQPTRRYAFPELRK